MTYEVEGMVVHMVFSNAQPVCVCTHVHTHAYTLAHSQRFGMCYYKLQKRCHIHSVIYLMRLCN